MEHLFDTAPAIAPRFRYMAGLVSEAVQLALIEEIRSRPRQAFGFHGFKANGRVLSYGCDMTSHPLVLFEIDPWSFPTSLPSRMALISREHPSI